MTEFIPEQLSRMKYVAGPFKGGVDYAIREAPGGSEVTIRNYGTASFSFPFMAMMMKRANRKDLALLKQVLERSGD